MRWTERKSITRIRTMVLISVPTLYTRPISVASEIKISRLQDQRIIILN
ncbi:MAG: hypothetical protein ABDH32_07010 [Candidatus Caldarchaeales archaeon]